MVKAVKLENMGGGIAKITMQDEVNKNTFSHELVSGLIDAYETIDQDETYKVAVLTGYDNYFASGGTQDSLLALHEGKMTFADVNMYSLAMDCKIPVIAAMQGHGIGGGFVMGLYSDIVVLSRESIYTTNFMKYGFTPGMGATYILPKKLGVALSQEMLMTASTFRGVDLEKRGVPFAVVSRREVVDWAMKLAEKLAEKPRVSLIVLKDHLVNEMRGELQSFIDAEVQMHEKTFHQREVKDRISTLFGK